MASDDSGGAVRGLRQEDPADFSALLRVTKPAMVASAGRLPPRVLRCFFVDRHQNDSAFTGLTTKPGNRFLAVQVKRGIPA